jgi:hypothetical protein
MNDDMVSPTSLHNGGPAMKTIVSALIALSVLAGVAGPANALDAKKFWDEHPTGGER